MIGVLSGQVVFSDGKEMVIQTQTGVGYQLFCNSIFAEGGVASVYVSHLVRENAEFLFAFKNLREKKLFELLLTVKGVGPKSAYQIASEMGVSQVISAVTGSDKAAFKKVKGVGVKAAAQIILDLEKKIQKIKMYSSAPLNLGAFAKPVEVVSRYKPEEVELNLEETKEESSNTQAILEDTLLACEHLGFASEKVVPLAQSILKENTIERSEQLVHLVLKEI